MQRQEADTISAPPEGRGPTIFVWGSWFVLSVGFLVFIVRYANNAPYWDDWCFIPQLTGREPVTTEWLWRPFNEHRLPLVRLSLVALGWMTGCDFRAQAVLNALILMGVAAAVIAVARRLRGWTSYADAFLPATLLHLGHHECFLGTVMLNHVLCMVFATGLLLLLLLSPNGLTTRAAALAGVLLLALPLCGANGLPVVVAFSLWMIAGALCRRPLAREAASGGPGHALAGRWLLLTVAGFALLLVALYFPGLQRPSQHPPPGDIHAWCRTTGQCLGTSCFSAAMVLASWPFSVAVVLALVLSGGGRLLIGFARAPERQRTLGLLLFLGAALFPALAVGWGRAALGPHAGLAPRYAMVMAPALLTLYFVWLLPGWKPGRELMPMTMFALSCLALPSWANHGREAGTNVRTLMQRFERDLRRGVPVDELVESHSGKVCWSMPLLTQGLRDLQRTGRRPWTCLRDESMHDAEEPLALAPSFTNDLAGGPHSWRGTGVDPYLVFALPSPRHVSAVRVRYRLSLPEGEPNARAQVFWSPTAGTPFTAETRNDRVSWRAGPEWHTHTVRINESVQLLRIDPHEGPCTFEIAELTLLVPAGQGSE